jgi:hypothetical protein
LRAEQDLWSDCRANGKKKMDGVGPFYKHGAPMELGDGILSQCALAGPAFFTPYPHFAEVEGKIGRGRFRSRSFSSFRFALTWYNTVEHRMKLGSIKISPAGRVVFFIFGAATALLTLTTISRGFIRIGGVERVRADEPVAFWCVMAAMMYLAGLWIFIALVKTKTDA